MIKDGDNGDPHSVGPGMDSEPSDWIIRVLGRHDPRPVWLSIWGGRYQPSGRCHEYIPAQDLRDGTPDLLYTIHRWRAAYQNEFEARMDWCVKDLRGANHQPTAVCNGDSSRQVLPRDVRPGQILHAHFVPLRPKSAGPLWGAPHKRTKSDRGVARKPGLLQ